MQQFTKQLWIILIFIQSLVVAEYAINKASALHREIPLEVTVNNAYNQSNYQFPNDDWNNAEALNPLWYRFSAATRHRQIVASTCSSDVDTIIGVYYYYQNLPVGFLNDDRTEENLSNGCFLLSSFVSLFIPRDTEFYVIIASFDSIDNLGHMDLKVYENYQQLFPTQVLIDALRAEKERLTNRINDIQDDYLSLQIDLASDVQEKRADILSEWQAVRTTLQEYEGNALARIDAFQSEILSKMSDLSDTLDIQSLISTTQDMDNLIEVLGEELNRLLATFRSIQMDTNYLQEVKMELTINYLDLDFTQRFNLVDFALALIRGNTEYLQGQFSNLQIITEKNKDFLENQIFAKYLLAKDTVSRMQIPNRYLTPAKYLGSMDELLEFVVGLYNEKNSNCQIMKRSIGCRWFSENTKGEYSRMINAYTRNVDSNQFVKAFEALQRFYEKLYPSDIFSKDLNDNNDDDDDGGMLFPARPGRAIRSDHYRFRVIHNN